MLHRKTSLLLLALVQQRVRNSFILGVKKKREVSIRVELQILQKENRQERKKKLLTWLGMLYLLTRSTAGRYEAA